MDQEKNSLKEICDTLSKIGIIKIQIEYAGSGDSGSVENITFFSTKKKYSKKNLPFTVKAIFSSFKNMDDLINLIENLATNFIAGNWSDNEGGQGTIYITTKTGKILIEAGYNETITNEDTEEYQL